MKRNLLWLVIPFTMMLGCNQSDSSNATAPVTTTVATTALAADQWGGEHIVLLVLDNGGSFQMDCASGTIDQPIRVDSNGNFHNTGTITMEGGPSTSVPPATTSTTSSSTTVAPTTTVAATTTTMATSTTVATSTTAAPSTTVVATVTVTSGIPATFDGTVIGDTMKLTISWTSGNQPIKTNLVLKRRDSGHLVRCL